MCSETFLSYVQGDISVVCLAGRSVVCLAERSVVCLAGRSVVCLAGRHTSCFSFLREYRPTGLSKCLLLLVEL